MTRLPLIGWSTVLAAALSLLLARVHPFANAGLHSHTIIAAPPHPQAATTNASPAALTGDPIRGKALFEKRCTGCHALTTDREGPPLEGVYGRRTASIPGFPYSNALRQANILWNQESLDRWLTDPDSFIPNSNMDFRVPKPEERKDLIAYMGTIHP